MNISEAARNRAFGPSPRPQQRPRLLRPEYINPQERRNRWISKGRQTPAVNYNHEQGTHWRGPGPNAHREAGVRNV